jgi:hypothetical protein
MSDLNELDLLFESETIKPTFDIVHIILSLYLFDKNPEGLGRYRLRDELLIGSGTSKSLFKRLEQKVNFIKLKGEKSNSNRKNIRKGHILTDKGLGFLSKIKVKIPFLEEGNLSVLKDIIIKSENIYAYFCLLRNPIRKITSGIEQRDAAIKVNGSGATCLIYNGKNLVFPPSSESVGEIAKVSLTTQNYFDKVLSTFNLKFRKNDIIIIGLGNNDKKARLAALNAALTLI